MKGKLTTAPPLSENYINNNILNFILSRKAEFNSHFNQLLLQFYWNTGSLIYTLSESILINKSNDLLAELSKIMQPEYGDVFSEENLTQMLQFYKKCDKGLLNNLYVVSWEHIIQLLNFAEPNSWTYYIRTVIEQRLTATELKTNILHSPVNEQSGVKFKSTDSPYIDIIFKNNNHFYVPFVDFFTPENLEIYNWIFFYSFKTVSKISKKLSAPIKILFDTTAININLLQNLASPYVNLRFSLSLFDLGDRTLEYSKVLPAKNSEILLEHVAAVLNKEVSPFFSVSKLKEIVNIASSITDDEERKLYASHIRWEHITILAKVNDIDIRNYFAQLAIHYNLSAKALKNQIALYMPYLTYHDKDVIKGYAKFNMMITVFRDSEIYGNILTHDLLLNKDFLLFMNTKY